MPTCKEALTETFAFMRVRSGPEMGLLIALVPVMLAYTIFCMLDLHPLLKPVQVTALSVAATAGLETLRFAAIFTVPALAAFAVRFYLLDQHSSDRHTRGEAPRLTALERLGAILLGAMVAVVFLALVALLWAAVLSPTSVQFQLLLFRGDFLMYFVTQAGIAAVVLSVALPACDLTAPQSAWVRRGLGLSAPSRCCSTCSSTSVAGITGCSARYRARRSFRASSPSRSASATIPRWTT